MSTSDRTARQIRAEMFQLGVSCEIATQAVAEGGKAGWKAFAAQDAVRYSERAFYLSRELAAVSQQVAA